MTDKIISIIITSGLALFLMRAMESDVTFTVFDLATVTVVFALFFVLYFRELRKALRIGELAAKKGLLTTEEVEIIIACQSDCSDKFGEIAVRENYLTETQLTRLISDAGY